MQALQLCLQWSCLNIAIMEHAVHINEGYYELKWDYRLWNDVQKQFESLYAPEEKSDFGTVIV